MTYFLTLTCYRSMRLNRLRDRPPTQPPFRRYPERPPEGGRFSGFFSVGVNPITRLWRLSTTVNEAATTLIGDVADVPVVHVVDVLRIARQKPIVCIQGGHVSRTAAGVQLGAVRPSWRITGVSLSRSFVTRYCCHAKQAQRQHHTGDSLTNHGLSLPGRVLPPPAHRIDGLTMVRKGANLLHATTHRQGRAPLSLR